MYDPMMDGQNHINIYSKAVTELGRYLTNFAASPILTVDGQFMAIEGYWYWLGTRNDTLRTLYGFKAKQFGKPLPRMVHLTEAEFQFKIREACWIKIHSNTKYLDLFTASTAPFAHYYVFGGTKVHDAGYKWLVSMWEDFRVFIKNGYLT